MASRTLKVEIIGDASSFQKALGNATKQSSGLSRAFRGLGIAAAGAGVAIGAGFVVMLKRGFDELSEAQKVSAQTAAGIKSTGAAANITAKQVEELAESLSKMSGVDDEVIQQGENLLLTFTKVRNEVGKGNDVFNRATEAALDLSVRGFGAMDSTSKMLGKALQDPIKGMTALGRAGVTFTESQKATIKGLVETGKQLEAQKLILKEVETQVGGSAKAYGETLPGQLSKLRNAFDEAAAKMAAKFLPILNDIVKSINENWPQIEKVVDQVMTAVVSAVGSAVSAIRTHFNTIKTVAVTAFQGLKAAVQGAIDFFRSDFGQQLGAAVLATFALSKAFVAVRTAILGAQVAMQGLSKNPFFLALIPLGIAIGVFAQRFIEAKVDAANFAQSLRDAASSGDALKASLDRLNESETALESSKLALISANRQAASAEKAWHAAVSESGKGSKAAQDSYLAYAQALNGIKQAQDGVTSATKANKDAEAERNTQLTGSIQKLQQLTGEMANVKQRGFEPGKYAADEFSKSMDILGDGARKAAREAAALGDEAGVKSARKVAILTGVAKDLAKELEGVPTFTEIIAEAKARNVPGFMAALEKIVNGAQGAADVMPGVGRDIGQGLATGMNSMIGVVQAAAAALARAAEVKARQQLETGSASKVFIRIGRDIVLGLAQGVTDNKEAKAAMKSLVKDPSVLAEIGAAAKELGASAVREIIKGVVGISPTLKAQTKQALADAVEAGRQAVVGARQGYADAFASLFQAGFDAIAAKYDGWVPPALLRKQREAEEREAAALKKSIEDAQAALQAAVAAGQALPPLKMGEIPSAEFKAAEKAVLDAQKTLDDLLFQQRQKMLDEKAIQQQKDKDKEIADEQASFAKKLKVIMASHRDVNAKVQALLKEFNIDFLKAGAAWGNQLAEGIRSAKKAVGDAAAELAQAAKNNTQNNSPKPKEGPLSKKSMYDAGREHGMNWAKGIASAAGAVGKAAATTAGGASGGFDNLRNVGTNIFDFGSGTPPPGGFGPDFEGSRPGWADRELWETIATMAAKTGKFDALIDAVQSGSIKANAGLLSQLFYARTRKTWNDFPARIAKILDDMRGPEGLSSAEAAAKYGLKKGGYVKQDGFAFLHKNEIVTPLPSGGRMSMGSQAININFNGTVMGGTEAQMARVLAPAIENEIRRSQRRGNASIVQAT